MIEAYRVGVSLVMDSNVPSMVGALSKQFELLNKSVRSTQMAVNELAAGLRGLGRIGTSAAQAWSSAAVSMERAAKAAERAGKAMPSSGGGGGGGGSGRSEAPARGPGPRVPVYPMPAVIANRSVTSPGSALVPYEPGQMDLRWGPPRSGGLGAGTLSGLGALLDQVGTAWAIDQSMREDLSIRSALLSMGFRPETAEFNSAIGRMRALAGAGATGTIFSESRAAEGMPAAAGVLGFGGDTPDARAGALAKFASIFPTVLRLGEVAEMQHMGSMQDAIVAAIGYAHMTDRYNPADLGAGLDRLLNVARLTHESVGGEQQVMKYSMPVGRAAGMNPDDVAALTGFLQIMGFSGTTAGTGLGQIITGLTPSAIQRLDSGHTKAMQSLGIVDGKGKFAADVMPNGSLDAMAMFQHIAEYAKSHKPEEVLGALRNAFTVRGMRVAGSFESPDAIPRLMAFIDQLNRLPGAVDTQKALAESPMQKFEQSLARLSDLANTLATATLPGLTGAFDGVRASADALNSMFKGNKPAAATAGYGLEGLAVGLLAAGGKGIWNLLSGSGLSGAATGTGALIRMGTGFGLLAGISSAINSALNGGTDWLENKIHGDGFTQKRDDLLKQGASDFWSIFGMGANAMPIRTDKPMDVRIVNPADIARGTTSFQADQASRPPTGPTQPTVRLTPAYPSAYGG